MVNNNVKSAAEVLAKNNLNVVFDAEKLAHIERFGPTLDQIKNLNKSDIPNVALQATLENQINYSLLPVQAQKNINVGQQVVDTLDLIVADPQEVVGYCNHLHNVAQQFNCLNSRNVTILEDEELHVAANYIRDLREVNTSKLNEVFSSSLVSPKPFTELLYNQLNPVVADIKHLITCHTYLVTTPLISFFVLSYTLITILGPNEFISVYATIADPKLLTESIRCCIIQKRAEVNYDWLQEKRLQATIPVFGFLLFGLIALTMKPSIDPTLLQDATTTVSSLESLNPSINSNTQINFNIFINIAKSFKGVFGGPSSDSALAFFKSLLKKN